MRRNLRSALAAALALLAFASSAGAAIRPGDEAEAPPPAVVALGLNPAYQVVLIASAIERDQACRAAHVAANDEFNPHRIVACVDVAGKRVILPPNAPASLVAHEYAHSWGYVHGPGGKGWIAPPAPAPYDWSKAFAS